MDSRDDLAPVVDQNQIAHLNERERHADRVDPEVIVMLRVARGDMAGDTVLVSVQGEHAQRGRQPFLAMPTLRFHRIERGWNEVDLAIRHVSLPRNAAARRWRSPL